MLYKQSAKHAYCSARRSVWASCWESNLYKPAVCFPFFPHHFHPFISLPHLKWLPTRDSRSTNPSLLVKLLSVVLFPSLCCCPQRPSCAARRHRRRQPRPLWSQGRPRCRLIHRLPCASFIFSQPRVLNMIQGRQIVEVQLEANEIYQAWQVSTSILVVC